jgi:hypothetical protein
MIDLLLTTGGSSEEIVEATGLSLPTIRRYLKALRELPKHENRDCKLRIVGWAPDARGYLTKPVYKLERGRDVPKIRFTGAEKTRRYRQRKAAPVIAASVFDLG